MKKIYVVFGSTGEFEDIIEWYLGAYNNENNAKSRVKELNNMLGDCYSQSKTFNSDYKSRDEIVRFIKNNVNGDKKCVIDYTGTSYNYFNLEVMD